MSGLPFEAVVISRNWLFYRVQNWVLTNQHISLCNDESINKKKINIKRQIKKKKCLNILPNL